MKHLILYLAAPCLASTPLLAQGAGNGPTAKPIIETPVEFAGHCAVVPMQLVSNIPVIEVTLGGKGPYRFAIDTGAQGHGRISAALAETLGLAVAGEARTPAPGGTLATRPIYASGPIRLGNVTFTGARLLAMATTRGPAPGWDGVLGIDLFRDVVLGLDYGNGLASVTNRPLDDGVTADFSGRIPAIPVEVAGRTFMVDLDTGNGASPLFLKEEDARALPLEGPAVERGRARTSFGDFAIMEGALKDPILVGGYELATRVLGWPTVRGNGNLGSKALAGSVLQVDRKSGRVAIKASGRPASCSPISPMANRS